MKTFLFSAAVALISATCMAAPCDSCFELGGEALLWKAASEPLRYGQVNPNPAPPTVSNQRILTLAPNHDWGVRIWGRYANPCCCYFAQVDWTCFHSINGASFAPTAGTTLRASGNNNALGVKATIKSNYDKVNIRLGACHQLSRCLGLSFYTGGRYIDLKHTTSQLVAIGGFVNPQVIEVTTEFEGGGLEFGVGADYEMGCGFSVDGNFGGVVAIGEQHGISRTQPIISASQLIALRNDPQTVCRPGTELRIALNYTYYCDCWNIKGTVGYAFDYYFSVFAPVNPSLNDDAFGIGWGGPVFALSLGF